MTWLTLKQQPLSTNFPCIPLLQEAISARCFIAQTNGVMESIYKQLNRLITS
jgi:hypothetical protein